MRLHSLSAAIATVSLFASTFASPTFIPPETKDAVKRGVRGKPEKKVDLTKNKYFHEPGYVKIKIMCRDCTYTPRQR